MCSEVSPGQIVCETLSRKKPIIRKDWWSGSRCRVQTPVLPKNNNNSERDQMQLLNDFIITIMTALMVPKPGSVREPPRLG
jgi:hypothetical protein